MLLLMSVQGKRIGMINVVHRIRMIYAERFCVFTQRRTVPIRFLKEIYSLQGLLKQSQKFIRWVTVTLGDRVLTPKPDIYTGVKWVQMPQWIQKKVHADMMNLIRPKVQAIMVGLILSEIIKPMRM